METINKVELEGIVRIEPTFLNLENGKKVTRFIVATTRKVTISSGETFPVQDHHTIVARNELAEEIHDKVKVPCNLYIIGKLVTTKVSYENDIRYITEVEADQFVIK